MCLVKHDALGIAAKPPATRRPRVLAHDDAHGGQAFGSSRDPATDVTVLDVNLDAGSEFLGHECTELAEHIVVGAGVVIAPHAPAGQDVQEVQLDRQLACQVEPQLQRFTRRRLEIGRRDDDLRIGRFRCEPWRTWLDRRLVQHEHRAPAVLEYPAA